MKIKRIAKAFVCIGAVMLTVFSCSRVTDINTIIDTSTNTDTSLNADNVNVISNMPEVETTGNVDTPAAEYTEETSEVQENTEEEVVEETQETTENITEPDTPEFPEMLETAETTEMTVIAEVTEPVETVEVLEAETTDSGENAVSAGDIEIPEDQITEILLSAIGDCSLASNYVKPYNRSFYSYYDTYGAKFFFENVLPVLEADDITVANLECALTDSENRLNKQYCYKGKKEYSSILVEGSVEIVNLENNHSGDYSAEGYADTIDAVKNAKIDYFGNGVITIREVKGIKIGFIGFMGSSDASSYRQQRLINDLAYLDENGADIKIVSFHWGNVDEKIANANQQLLAHCAIDNGADLVLGHHPHVLQGIEVYNGKYIVYSLGNFIFDGNMISDEEHRSTMIFQQKIVLEGRTIIDTEINIIPVYATSNLSMNNFQPMFVDGERKDRILQKIAERSP